jgi:DNA-nicking Smr family endonuclease
VARKAPPFNNPFLDAAGTLRDRLKADRKAKKKARAQASPPPSPPPPAGDDEAELFEAAMADVAPLQRDRKVAPQRPPPIAANDIPIYDEDAEAYAELASLVEGRARFDISDGDEFIEGCVEGLDRRVLQRLRRGDYAYRSFLDLHGMTRTDAKDAVERFLWEKREEKHRAVLIVHGRGKNSKDNIPVLKEALLGWLQRGRISRCVLAFSTARPHDGGAGAMYVLLRR